MSLRATFRCAAGCPGEHPLDEVLYTCPRCGDLLEVAHDREALAATPAAEWRARFDARYRSPSGPFASGVWGKREWVQPHLRDEHLVTFGEGATHLQPVPGLARALGLAEVWVKHCGTSHTGSFKDLGMTVLVSTVKQMIADGRTIPAVACASTGDTSAALAAYAAAAGIPALVILPRGKVSPAQLVQPLANGATVLALETDFDGCMDVVRRLAAEEGVYLANSMNSLRVEGQKTVGIEIVQQLGWEAPDWIVIPGGNLGNASALGAGLLLLRELGLVDRLPRICVAQAEAANPLYRAYRDGWRFEPVVARPTLASAIQIGNPVSIGKAIRTLRALGGIVEQATEAELADAAAHADRFGLFCDPHTGVALAALARLAARGDIRPHERAVVVSTASGLKFAETKTRYHTGELATPGRYARTPVLLPADYARVRDEVRRVTGAA